MDLFLRLANQHFFKMMCQTNNIHRTDTVFLIKLYQSTKHIISVKNNFIDKINVLDVLISINPKSGTSNNYYIIFFCMNLSSLMEEQHKENFWKFIKETVTTAKK